MQSVTDELSLMDYVAVVRRRWLLIVSCAVLLALAGFGWSSQQTKQYQGKAEVLVDFSSSAQYVQPSGGSNQIISSTDRARALQNEIRFAKSRIVLDPLDQKLGHKADLTVGGQTSTADVLTFTAKSPRPADAAAEANAYAQAYVAGRSQRVVSSYADVAKVIDDVLTDLHKRLASLAAPTASGVDPDATQRQALESQIKIYEGQKTALDASAKVGQGSGATIITQADTPASPFSPKPVRTAALALAVGLILGIGLAFLREFLDDTIRNTDDLERTAEGATILGAIPKDRVHASARPATSQMSTAPLDEAFRSLRTSVQFIGLHRQLRAVQVTSANAAEGKTTVASHLAAALVYGGDHVVLIDGDLRNPSLHTRFGIRNDIGLSTVMLGQAELRSALRPVDGLPGLLILPAGPLPGNPADFLWPATAPLAAGTTLPDLIGRLTREGYRVVIDCPPVLPVADAMTISRMVDGTIVVVSAGSTGSRSLGQALQQLAQAEAQVVGIAFNSVTESAGYGYGYGYGYGPAPTGLLARLRARLSRKGRRGAHARPISGDTGWQGRPLGARPADVGSHSGGLATWRPGSANDTAPAPAPRAPVLTPQGVEPGPGAGRPVDASGVNGSNGSPTRPERVFSPERFDGRTIDLTHARSAAMSNGTPPGPVVRPLSSPPPPPPPPVHLNSPREPIHPARLSRAWPPTPEEREILAKEHGLNGVSTPPAQPGEPPAISGFELEEALRRHLGTASNGEAPGPSGSSPS